MRQSIQSTGFFCSDVPCAPGDKVLSLKAPMSFQTTALVPRAPPMQPLANRLRSWHGG